MALAHLPPTVAESHSSVNPPLGEHTSSRPYPHTHSDSYPYPFRPWGMCAKPAHIRQNLHFNSNVRMTERRIWVAVAVEVAGDSRRVAAVAVASE